MSEIVADRGDTDTLRDWLQEDVAVAVNAGLGELKLSVTSNMSASCLQPLQDQTDNLQDHHNLSSSKHYVFFLIKRKDFLGTQKNLHPLHNIQSGKKE